MYPHRYQPLDIALATVADAVIATDAQEKVIFLNPAAESLTGWRAIDALGKPLEQIFMPVDPGTGGLLNPMSRMAEPSATPPAAIPAAFVDRAGGRADIEYSTVAMRDEGGRLIGTVVVWRLRLVPGAEQDRTQMTLNAIGDAVVSVNFSGRVNYLNAAAARLTGWTQSDACGCPVDEIFTLVERSSRAAIACPAARAIIENRRVTPAAACLGRRRDGSEVAIEVSAAPMHDQNGRVIGAVMVAHEVAAAPEKSDQLGRSELHHKLDELPTRLRFSDRLAQAIADARAKGRYAALLHVGLDRFDSIRTAVGHGATEGLLEAVARRLVRCVRTSDIVGRQGDDVFVVLLTDLARVNDAAVCAEKILVSLQSPYRIAEDVLRLSANVGIALFPIDANEGDALLRCADFAMYQARYDGRNNYRLFSPRAPGDPSA